MVQYFTLSWSYEAGVGAKKSRVVVTTERSICGSQGWENALLTGTLGTSELGLHLTCSATGLLAFKHRKLRYSALQVLRRLGERH